MFRAMTIDLRVPGLAAALLAIGAVLGGLLAGIGRAAYSGGEVEEFPIHQYGTREAALAAIAERLGESGVGAVLSLSSSASRAAIGAVLQDGSGVPIGAVGFSGDVCESALRGIVSFVIRDQPLLQSFLSASAMLLAEQLYTDPAAWFGGAIVRIEPRVFERPDLIRMLDDLVAPPR